MFHHIFLSYTYGRGAEVICSYFDSIMSIIKKLVIIINEKIVETIPIYRDHTKLFKNILKLLQTNNKLLLLIYDQFQDMKKSYFLNDVKQLLIPNINISKEKQGLLIEFITTINNCDLNEDKLLVIPEYYKVYQYIKNLKSYYNSKKYNIINDKLHDIIDNYTTRRFLWFTKKYYYIGDDIICTRLDHIIYLIKYITIIINEKIVTQLQVNDSYEILDSIINLCVINDDLLLEVFTYIKNIL